MTTSERIVVDLSVAPPGGAGTYAAGFARGLVEAAVDDPSTVVVLVDARWADAHADIVAALTTAGHVVDRLDVAPPGSWAARLGRGRVLRRAVARHDAAVAYVPRDVAPALGVATVILANNLYAWQRFESYGAIGGRLPARLLRLAARRSARRAAAVLAVSRTMARALPAGRPATAIVHHGCDLPEGPAVPDRRGDERRVLLVGNVIANKGIDVVIDAVAAARARGGPWELDVHGGRADEAYAESVEAHAHEVLGAGVLRGPAYGPDLVAAYGRADVVAVGGTFESFCYPLVEAMRSGCVVVAPASELVAELCGDVAVTYRPGDPAALAEALDVAWAERADRRSQGLVRSRSFTWSRTVEVTLGHVRAAAATPGGAGRR